MAFTVPRRLCLLLVLTSCVSLGHVPYHSGASWTSYDFHRYPHPERKPALPRDIMVDVINNLGLKLLAIHNEYNENNIAISPYGALSVLIALGEGVQGEAVIEIQQCAKIPNDISVIRVGLRDIHRHLKSYFIPKEGFLAGLTLNHDNVTLRTEYQDILKFYGFDIFTFNNGLYPEPETTVKPSPKTSTTSMASSELTTMPTTKTTEIPTTNNISRTIETIATETNPEITTTIVTEATTLEFKSVEPKFDGTPLSQDVTVTDLLTTSNPKLSNPTTLNTTVIPVTQNPILQETTLSRTQLTTEVLETRNVPTTSAQIETTTIAVEEEATTIQKTTREIPTETTTETREGTTTEETETKKSTGKPPLIPAMTNSFVTTILTTETSTEIPTATNIPSTERTTSSQTSEDIQTPDTLQTISRVQTTEGIQIVEGPQTTENLQTTESSQTTETTQTPDNSQSIRSVQTIESSQTTESLQSTENSQTTNIIQILDNLQPSRSVQTTERIQSNDRLETNPDNLQTTDSARITKNIHVTTAPSTRKENLVAMAVTKSENNDTSIDATTIASYPYPETRNQIENEIIPNNNNGALEILKRDARSQRLKIEKDVVELNVFHKNDHRNHRRKTRSLVDYIIAQYYDELHFSRHNGRAYVPEEQLGFLINGKFREYQINFMKYDAVLPFCYVSHLNAAALSFPLDNVNYYLLLLLPLDENGLDQLICDIRLNESFKYIIDNLRYKHVIATIPSFELKGYVNLTPSIQKLGIQRIFEPRQADFSPMTDHRNVYVTNIEQAITVNIRNYMDRNALEGSRNLRQFEPLEFKADHPFLYFVLDSELHVTLMAGKIINPLNARIR